MIALETVVELLLSMIDYSCCLYFYKKLMNENISKKIVVAIIVVTLIQFFKEIFFSFSQISNIIDTFIIVGFLFFCSEKRDMKSFISAMMINTLFSISVMIFVSITLEIEIDVEKTLNFGIDRVTFALSMKVFTLTCFILLEKYFSKLVNQLKSTVDNFIVLLITSLCICLSYVVGSIKITETIFIYSFLLLVIAILIFYLLYRYSLMSKKQIENELIQREIQTTSTYVKRLEEEHEEVRKIRHDMKNQLQVMQYLLREKKYKEIEQNLGQLAEDLDYRRVSISGNIYIDAVLRQKMAEFADIHFSLEMFVTKDFEMDGTDLISLLSNIIDNACEELHRIHQSEMELTIKGDAYQLYIKERNACREKHDFQTDKSKKEHGYGLKIIREITNKYEGNIELSVNPPNYEISVYILFQ